MIANDEKYFDLAIKTAKRSPCKKRKVGAVVVLKDEILGIGYNHNTSGWSCEDENGYTLDEVVHAEIAALVEACNSNFWDKGATLYVTHPPCDECLKAIADADITDVRVVGSFMKFDNDKLRYDLVPTETLKALAQVLTYGAKKYKPNNWQQADDHSRYVAALYRHLEAWRSGESCDEESGLSHLSHAITNLAFLQYFEEHK